MNNTTACLISAGISKRMGDLTSQGPKCLLPIYQDKCLLDFQLDTLISAGITSISIVTGYHADKIENHIEQGPFRKHITLNVSYNPFFRSSNNIFSYYLALLANHSEQQDLITINGDDLFTSDAIVKLMASGQPVSCLTSEKSEYDDDDMKAVVDENRFLQDVGKDLDLTIVNAESVGIFRIESDHIGRLADIFKDYLFLSENALNDFYLKVFRHCVQNLGLSIKTIGIAEASWREMDFAADYYYLKEDLAAESFRKTFMSSEHAY